MPHPDLNLLLALDALLDEGSVIGAARRMNLSPPAMSRTLSRIRDALADPVLIQVGRKLVPTPKALALREQVRMAVEQAVQVFSSDAEIDLKSLERRFNVRATDEFVSMHLGHLLGLMATDMPVPCCVFHRKKMTWTRRRCAVAALTSSSAVHASWGRRFAYSRCLQRLMLALPEQIIRFLTMKLPPSVSPSGSISTFRDAESLLGP